MRVHQYRYQDYALSVQAVITFLSINACLSFVVIVVRHCVPTIDDLWSKRLAKTRPPTDDRDVHVSWRTYTEWMYKIECGALARDVARGTRAAAQFANSDPAPLHAMMSQEHSIRFGVWWINCDGRNHALRMNC